MLDIYELCTPELQEKMVSYRSKFKDLEDKKVNQQTKNVRDSANLIYAMHKIFFRYRLSFIAGIVQVNIITQNISLDSCNLHNLLL